MFILLYLMNQNLSFAQKKKEIVIAGLFPISEDIEAGAIGRGVRPAVKLALDMVNNDSRILKDYDLKMTWNDTGVSISSKLFLLLYDM